MDRRLRIGAEAVGGEIQLGIRRPLQQLPGRPSIPVHRLTDDQIPHRRLAIKNTEAGHQARGRQRVGLGIAEAGIVALVA